MLQTERKLSKDKAKEEMNKRKNKFMRVSGGFKE